MQASNNDDIITEQDLQKIEQVISRVNQYVLQNNSPVYVAKSRIENAGFGLFAPAETLSSLTLSLNTEAHS